MKTLILTFLSICITTVSLAQIAAGTKSIGGSFSFGHQEQESNSGDNRSTFISINPRFGKAVKDNLVNGVVFSYSFSQQSSTSAAHSIGFGVYRQKYLPLGNSFMVYGEGNLGASYGWRKSYHKAYSISAGLGAGLAYNASDRLLLTLALPNALNGYVYYHENVLNNTAKSRSFGAGINSVVPFREMQFGILLMRK
jgi:hypothetical protein